MKRTIFSILCSTLIFVGCTKDELSPKQDPCFQQIDNPSGRTYTPDSIVGVSYDKFHCGLLPLSSKSYWVYEDSVFLNGIFERVQYDTLRFKSYQSLSDKLIWWKGSIEIGLPELLYSNDSNIYLADYRLFAPDPIMDVKKEYGLFSGDSIKYLTSFEDFAALGRSVKCAGSISTPAGNFSGCIMFEKMAPFFRKDQVFFKPGIGVVKFYCEKAPMGSPSMSLHQVSTLVSYHIE